MNRTYENEPFIVDTVAAQDCLIEVVSRSEPVVALIRIIGFVAGTDVLLAFGANECSRKTSTTFAGVDLSVDGGAAGSFSTLGASCSNTFIVLAGLISSCSNALILVVLGNVAGDVGRNDPLSSWRSMMSLKAGMALSTDLIGLSQAVIGGVPAILMSFGAVGNAHQHVRRNDGANGVIRWSHTEESMGCLRG